MAANDIADPNIIWAGQKLVIPGSEVPAAGETATEATLEPSPTNTAAVTPVAERTGSGASTQSLPTRVYLEGISHEWQRLNNCGPVTVGMALSFYGETVTQYDTAPILKGGEEDKNVSPADLTGYLTSKGYGARILINGDLDILRRLVANNIPVIAEQWLIRENDPLTGHYRLVRGYDQEAGVFVVNDSYLGPNLRFTDAEFDRRWRGFNRLYVPVYRPEQEPLVREIIGSDWDEQTMYARALPALQGEVEDIGDIYAWFNLGDVYLGLGRYEEAVNAFEQAISLGLPERMLWYRFGLFKAYNEAGQYQKTIELANGQLATVPALEEVLYYRGQAYEALGQFAQAEADYQTAVQYNARFQPAQEALAMLPAIRSE